MEELFAPSLKYYRAAGFSPILEGSLAEAVYPEKRPILLLWVPGILLLLSFLTAGRSIKQIWIVPVLLIVLAYPHAALAWHGDSNDVGRHALLAGVHLRLGLWLLLSAGETYYSLAHGKDVFLSGSLIEHRFREIELVLWRFELKQASYAARVSNADSLLV